MVFDLTNRKQWLLLVEMFHLKVNWTKRAELITLLFSCPKYNDVFPFREGKISYFEVLFCDWWYDGLQLIRQYVFSYAFKFACLILFIICFKDMYNSIFCNGIIRSILNCYYEAISRGVGAIQMSQGMEVEAT